MERRFREGDQVRLKETVDGEDMTDGSRFVLTAGTVGTVIIAQGAPGRQVVEFAWSDERDGQVVADYAEADLLDSQLELVAHAA